MHPKIRVAVVGVDGVGRFWGARAHVPAVRATPQMELVAICTAHDETAKLAAEKFGIPMYFWDYKDAVNHPDIDLITVAVRVRYHHRIVKAALEAGKMVFCEWPLGMNSQEALELAQLAEQKSIQTAVGTQGRFSPGLSYLKRLLEQNYIGRPLFFHLTHFLPKFEIWSDHSWPAKNGEANDVLFVATAHSIDSLRVCLGEPESVIGTQETLMPQWRLSDTNEGFEWTATDTVSCQVQLRNKIMGTIHVSHACWSGTGFRLEVYGEGGKLVAAAPGYVSYSPIRIFSAKNGERERQLLIPKELYKVRSINEKDPAFSVGQLLHYFVSARASKSVFHPNFRDAYSLHKIIEAIDRSSVTKKWESVGTNSI